MTRKQFKPISLTAITLAMALTVGGCGGALDSTTSNNTTTAYVAAIRSLRLYQAYSSTILAPLTSGPISTLLSDGNLYSRSTLSGNITTISYYTDAAGTIGAGTVIATNTSTNGANPTTFSTVLNITGGIRPLSGNINVVIGTGVPGSLTGAITEGSGNSVFTVTPTLSTNAGVATGSVAVVSGSTTVNLSNVVLTTVGTGYTLQATTNIPSTGSTGTVNLTLNADGSGTGSLQDGSTVTWQTNGSGTISLNNGTGATVSINNFDLGA